MHFGKTCAPRYSALFQCGLPPFQYKELKKCLKQLGAEVGESPGNDIQARFRSTLSGHLQQLDAQWVTEARLVLQADRAPHFASAHLKFWRSSRAEPSAAALDEWGKLTRTGLRKICKKYNQRFGLQHGRISELQQVCELHFPGGKLSAEIESLARQTRALSAGGSSADDAGSASARSLAPGDRRGDLRGAYEGGPKSSSASDCPVCLSKGCSLVAPPCGHHLCYVCFLSLAGDLEATTRDARCPVCGGDASTARPLTDLTPRAAYAAGPIC